MSIDVCPEKQKVMKTQGEEVTIGDSNRKISKRAKYFGKCLA